MGDKWTRKWRLQAVSGLQGRVSPLLTDLSSPPVHRDEDLWSLYTVLSLSFLLVPSR